MIRYKTVAGVTAVLALLAGPVMAAVHQVAPGTNLSAFFTNTVQNGDIVELLPGTHGGAFVPNSLSNVTVRSADPSNPAIINGQGLQFVDPQNLTFESFIVQNVSGNFINIDDGGSFDTPARNITFRNMTFRQPASSSTNGIKLAGVVGFRIENCTFIGFGDTGGIGIDGVGAMEGVVRNSVFTGTAGDSGYGIQFKGGSENIVIRANRFDTYGTRGVNNGGSTGDTLFRPGPQGFEARNIHVEGNVFINGNSPNAFASSDGGSFRHNLVVNPTQNLGRILTEKIFEGTPYRARNGAVIGNYFTWQGTRSINVGPDTQPETFTFANNHWYNQSNPANSHPRFDHDNQLIPETGGTYGVPITLDANRIVPWTFDWGLWLVNASLTEDTFSLGGVSEPLVLAIPGDDAVLDLGKANPLEGTWTFQTLGSSITLPAMTDAILIRQSLLPEPGSAVLLIASLGLLVRPRSSVR